MTEDIEALYNGTLEQVVDQTTIMQAFPAELFKHIGHNEPRAMLGSADTVVADGAQGEYDLEDMMHPFTPEIVYQGTMDIKTAVKFNANGSDFSVALASAPHHQGRDPQAPRHPHDDRRARQERRHRKPHQRPHRRAEQDNGVRPERNRGIAETRKRGNAETRKRGIAEARKRGNAETRKRGIAESQKRGIAESRKRGNAESRKRRSAETQKRGNDSPIKRLND